MCGLSAFFARNAQITVEQLQCLQRVNDRMIARGPDSSGHWVGACNQIALAHRRLAIQDLSPAGRQPMSEPSQRYTVVFNGEIYNFPELRVELAQRGVVFLGHSDTEVLIHAYAAWGADCLPRLRGMFAFVIWDALEHTLFAARDAFGIKPLYWAQDKKTAGGVWFASQVKALAMALPCLTESAAGRAGFLIWGHIPEPFTPFNEIRALPAGHYLHLRAGEVSQPEPRRWFDLSASVAAWSAAAAPRPKSGADLVEYVRASLLDSVHTHRIADVPVGVFLSAGLDSSTLAALCAEDGGNDALHAVTLGFSEYQGTSQDEVPLATELAQRLGAQHTVMWVSKDDFLRDFEHILDVMDQPSIDGANTYYVSKLAHQSGLKVAISGLGGDELFGGYGSFRQVPQLAALPSFLQYLGRPARSLLEPFLSDWKPKLAGVLEYSGSYERAYLLRRALFMPWELHRVLEPEQVAEGLAALATLPQLRASHAPVTDGQLKVSLLESQWYMRNQLLRDSDWASMAHSLELRVPLVDLEFWRRMVPLRLHPTRVSKQVMAQTPRLALTLEHIRRKKTGFAIPITRWFAESINEGEQNLSGGLGFRHWAVNLYPHWLQTIKK
jgi:asparagine synthase (glutamine-hydrolysing)